MSYQSKKYFLKKLIVITLLLIGLNLSADVSIAKIFSDNMVLQRNQPLPVWGWDTPGKKVTVSIDDQIHSAITDTSGRWMVTLNALSVGTPKSLTVKGTSILTLKNILVGEVWLCSGQSNMEWGIKTLNNAKEEVANATHPNIRLFFVPKTMAKSARQNLPASCNWKMCTPENILKGSHRDGFSGTAYYFGRALQKKLGVPIGLIQSAWGGTRIEPWTPPVGFEGISELSNISSSLKSYRTNVKKSLDAIKKWEAAARQAIESDSALPEAPNFPQSPVSNHQSPTSLYNAMIHPLIPFAINGAIWYQGESNRGEGMLYYHKMRALINGWRRLWKRELPFYYVQLAPFTYRGSATALPEIWEAQSAALDIKNTGMAIINDIGNLRDIHPRNKQEVGRRLALLALAKTYKKDIPVYCGPIYKSMNIEGNKIRVHFDHAGSGLTSRDGKPLTHFEIAAGDGKFVPASAQIDGKALILSAKGLNKPSYIRFAWHQQAVPNLMNKEGLPASTFRVVPKNLALNKPYNTNAPNKHNYGIKGLTDGSWALNNGTNCFATNDQAKFPKHVTVDLQQDCKLNNIRFGVPPYGSTKTVKVLISSDNNKFTEVGSHTFKQKKEERFNLALDVSARYIRLVYVDYYPKKIQFPQTFAFTTELEVYGSEK